MIRNLLICFILLSFMSVYCQDEIVCLSHAINSNSEKFIQKSNAAFAQNDFVEGNRLFDSLVNYKLVGTRFDNLDLVTFSSKKITTDKFKKPLLIITYASWCVINKGDIPALNELAKKNKSDLDILIIFWGDKSESKRISKLFNSDIQIAFADFLHNKNNQFVSLLKNVLGFPASYLIDTNKKVVAISRVKNPYSINVAYEIALNRSYEDFSSIVNKAISKEKKNIIAVN